MATVTHESPRLVFPNLRVKRSPLEGLFHLDNRRETVFKKKKKSKRRLLFLACRLIRRTREWCTHYPSWALFSRGPSNLQTREVTSSWRTLQGCSADPGRLSSRCHGHISPSMGTCCSHRRGEGERVAGSLYGTVQCMLGSSSRFVPALLKWYFKPGE